MTKEERIPNLEMGSWVDLRMLFDICASSLRNRDCLSGRFREVETPMENTASIQCPFCGQRFELVIDTSIASQRFTTDCEVCCRPFEVVAECEPGEIVSLQVMET